MCLITNMTDHKRVEIKTENETPALNASGVLQYESGLSDATTLPLLKKYDTKYFIIVKVNGTIRRFR